MPKMKTHKGASSRIKVSGSGKLLRMKGNSSHLKRKKSQKVKRTFHDTVSVHKADVKRLKKLIYISVCVWIFLYAKS